MSAPLTFHEALRGRSDAQLDVLLEHRPDLTVPAPASIAALAARAGSRPSTERALTRLDAFELHVLEAATALATPDVTADAILAALGVEPGSATAAQVSAVLDRLVNYALLWRPLGDGGPFRLAPAVAEALGPHPAGLGPTVAEALNRYSAARRQALAEDLGVAVEDDPLTGLVDYLTDEAKVQALLADAPPEARRLLEVLTWGPPVGEVEDARRHVRAADAVTAVDWLLSRGILMTVGATHVVLPREIGLMLRGGRTHRSTATEPPVPQGMPADSSSGQSRRDQAASRAELLVRWTTALLRDWSMTPPPVLRSGGLGLRDVKRMARVLDAAEHDVVVTVELAKAAGLIVDSGGDDPRWLPTAQGEDLLEQPLTQAWADLAAGWLASERTPWLVGTRDTKGELRPALHPDLERPWAARLRRQVLTILARFPEQVLTTDDVLAQLAWDSPRAVPPKHVVEAILDEITLMGLADVAGAATTETLAGHREDAADALAMVLPPEVDTVTVRADLTAVTTGRPSAALSRTLDLVAELVSTGSEHVYRFTQSSVRRGLDAGRTADELLEELASVAVGAVPDELGELLRDEARTHGQLRVGAASAYIRTEDPTLVATLVADPAMAPLGLIVLAPTVLAAQMPPGAVVELLRSRGLSPGVEGPDGKLVVKLTGPRRAARRAASTNDKPSAIRRVDASGRMAIIASMREGEDRVGHTASPRGPVPTSDPSLVLATLRDAAESGSVVEIVVAGTDGAPRRRRVLPLTIEGGRLRARDLARGEEEMSVAVSRIGAAHREG